MIRLLSAIPKTEKLPRGEPKRSRTPMTFIVGLKCCDGVVLCTDSLEDDTITKKTVNKIALFESAEWGLALAGAGGGRIIDKFWNEVVTQLPRQGSFDRSFLEGTIETVLADFKAKYDESFVVIAAVHSGSIGQCFLYKGSQGLLSPVFGDCHTGVGNEIWALMADGLYNSQNSVEDNLRLAFLAAQLAAKYASGVDKPIQIVSFTLGEQRWKVHSPGKLFRLEVDVSVGRFREALKRYWSQTNPPTMTEQLAKYGSVSTGQEITILNGVKIEELETGAGRNRVSGFLFGNKDILRKRASLERERLQQKK